MLLVLQDVLSISGYFRGVEVGRGGDGGAAIPLSAGRLAK